MDECAERIPAQLSRQVLHSNPRADVPDISWIGESETAIHVSHRFPQEPLVLRVTTDDPIECDDVGGRKLTRHADKIPADESDRRGSPATRRLLGCRRDKRR